MYVCILTVPHSHFAVPLDLGNTPQSLLLLCCCFPVKAQTADCPECVNKLLAGRKKKKPAADSSDQCDGLPCRSVVETLMSSQAFVLGV